MKKLLLLTWLFATIAAGCKKDEKKDETPSVDRRYLERYVISHGSESITYRLTYDDKGRLIAHQSHEDERSTRITYDSKDNPVKFEIASSSIHQVYDISYNSAGVPLRAMHVITDVYQVDEPFITEITYEVSDGKVSKLLFKDEEENESSYVLSYTGNNLSKVIHHTPGSESILNLTHGNRKSPFSAARFKYLVIRDLFSTFSSENEITRAETMLLGVFSLSSSHEYVYDAKGYPTSSIEKDEAGDILSTTVYHYK